MRRLRIFVTGSSGRLGRALCRRLGQMHDVVALDRRALDLATPVSPQLPPEPCDWIINCGAVTSVEACAENSDMAVRINGEAVGELATAAAERGARLLQVSTDYVFAGRHDRPCSENAPPGPLTVYGRSKLLGEEMAQAANPQNIIARVSWVFGPDRPAFPDMVLSRALEHSNVYAVFDKKSSPTYTVDAAEWFLALITAPGAAGIYHLCNAGSCTWQEYGQAVLDAALREGLPLKTSVVEPIAMKDFAAFRVPRPVYTALSTERFTALTGIIPRPWQEAIADYVAHLARSYRDEHP